MKKQIGIVGGGSSGMMAAVIAARQGAKVTLFEHGSRIGKKILSTGNGKCNFTNLNLSKDDYNGNHPSFVASALSKFDQQAAISFFEKSGMLSTNQRGGYYYPYSAQASTVLNLFRMMLAKEKVQILTETIIERIEKKSTNRFLIITKEQKKYEFDAVILACGGAAAPVTGSDGSGYSFAKQFGHTIMKPLPALTFLTSKDKILPSLQGVRCAATLSLYADDQLLQTEEGELQLNKTNLSGIPVFQLSHNGILALNDKKKVKICVDFLSSLSLVETKDTIDFLLKEYEEQNLEDALGGLLHKKVLAGVLNRAGVSGNTKACLVSTKKRNEIAKLMHEFCFEINGFGDFANAQVTMGGVNVKELDENMMSKKVEGLYIIGEMQDVDGRCGGYNLQWAWTTGYIAGLHSVTGEVKCLESHNAKQK